MLSLLAVGFLLGMRHAVEADHVAAVASLATRPRSIKDIVRLGAVWGIGHTLTLLLFGSIVMLVDTAVPATLAMILETAVGLMLIALGADVLRTLLRDRLHFHVHKHGDGRVHFHAHSHAGEKTHDSNHHEHEHARGFPLRALLVGLMHGMAGSAALIVLTLQSVSSWATGLLYIILFGMGSIAGMAVLSTALAIPLRWTSGRFTWMHKGLHAAVGITTMALGIFVVYQVGIQHGVLALAT